MKRYQGSVSSQGRLQWSLTLVFALLISFIAVDSKGQVCCPDFKLKDAVEICTSDQACPPGGTAGQGKGMAACKLSAHTYTVYPNTAPYTYTWTVTGGTASLVNGNPNTITWGSGSTGFIKVVITGGGCHDSITQQICLIDGPQANFTAAPNPVCTGSPVTFTNTSAGGSAYFWDFGDGTTSTLANPPPHVYSTSGPKTVILTATDMGGSGQTPDQRIPCGCSDTASMVINVLSGAGPNIDLTCCYGTVCPGDTSSFCTSQVCTTYNWTVTGGVIISGAGTSCIKVKWNAVYSPPGTTVSLSVPGCAAAPCAGTTTINVPVLYPNLPISGPNPICVGSAASFFLPSMPGTFYTWSTVPPTNVTFNDKDRNVANVNLTFSQAGVYQVICNYNNPMAGCSGSSVLTVNVLPVFSIFGPDKVCQYSSPTYSGTGGTSATWTVTGPNTPVPLVGPSTAITWNTPGRYTITATPTPGIYCNLNAIKVVEVVAVPILGAISGPNLSCPGKNLAYTVTSNTTGSPFYWSAVGGTVQTEFGPDKSQAIIKLTSPSMTISVYQEIEISPGVLCQSLAQTLVVNTYGPPVVTPPGPLTVCVDAVTTFTATGPTPVTWTVSPPNRGTVISGQGTNVASIKWHGPPTAVNGASVSASHCGGVSNTVLVTILNPPVTPVITATGPFTYCLPLFPAPGFTLSVVPAGYTSYQWYGPGGLIAGATNSSYTPPPIPGVPGTYGYTVVVSNGVCTATSTVIVFISNPPCGGGGGGFNCAIDFTINPNPVCEGEPATFTAQQVLPNTSDPGFSYQWAFGDGATSFQSPTQHSYLLAGTYNVTLTATLGTCVTTKVHQITVNPTPNCTITASDTMYCPGSSVILSAGCTGPNFQWYRDGVLISGATNSTYNANQYGDHWVFVTNAFGCGSNSNHIYIYEKALPTAKISGESTVCSAPLAVASFNLSSYYNANYSYSWSSIPAGATFSPNNSNGAFFTNVSLTLPGTLPYTASFVVQVTDVVTNCINYDTICVTFFETPTVSVPFYFGCEGAPVTLTSTPGPLTPSSYYYHWSNGKTTQSITVSQPGSYALTITDKVTGCSASVNAAIINPLPDLSLFPRGCDSICSTDSIRMYIPLPLNALPPFNTVSSAYPVITWYANGNYGSPIGSGPNFYYSTNVLGSHQISVVVQTVFGCLDTAGVFCLNVIHCDSLAPRDFGDAPQSSSAGYNYPTLLPTGARHYIVPGVYLGAQVDAEPNGQPSIGADCDDNDCSGPSGGDDEDGVVLPTSVDIGSLVNFTVQSSVNGYLDAWIDYDINGNWAAAGEHIFTSLFILGGPATPLSFTVPATATMGQSYARFRFRTANTPISYNGLAMDGEVEDYPIFINDCTEGHEIDFGDAPDMPPTVPGFHYPTLLSTNGARHLKYNNVRLGALIDVETNGQPNTPSLGDDMATSDDEDGVVFVGKMYVGLPATVQVTASLPGFLNAWMDFNKDGDWADAGEQIYTNQPLVAGMNNLTFMIPATAQQGKTYTRFRFNTLGGLTYFGLALNGEVEDYQVHACPHWWPVHTNLKHYITIPHDLPNLVPGDVLGVFYLDAAGERVCAGLSEFNGSDDQILIAYGDNLATPVKDGFAVGEPIYWKLCSMVKGDANPVDVVYDFTYPSHNGLYAQNGISALAEINGLHVMASANPGTICPGQAVQLHADAGGAEGVSYSWTSLPAGFVSDIQNPDASPTVNTTYTVQAYDGVFTSTSSVHVSVTQVSPLVEILPLNNITIPSGQSNCYNATLSISTGGNGTQFVVENGGSANLIAGQKIRLLPGTRGMAGGYLHGKITLTGEFCCAAPLPLAPVATGDESAILPVSDKSFFKVYPNPTTGSFTVELLGVPGSSKTTVEIYGILGETILKKEITGMKRQVFDLSGRQHGVYLIRVMSDGETGMTKIIKQ